MAPKKKDAQAAPPPTRAEPTRESTSSSAEAGRGSANSHPQLLNIARRPFDLFFILGYTMIAQGLIVALVVECKHIFPDCLDKYCEPIQSLSASLNVLVDVYKAWGNHVFSSSEVFILQVVGRVNTFVLLPFSVILAYGFLTGGSWVKNVALLHSSALLYTMLAYVQVGHDVQKHGRQFLGFESYHVFIYLAGCFVVFPLAVIFRVWSATPFHSSKFGSNTIVRWTKFWLKALLFLWLLSSGLTFYEIAAKHTKHKYPSAVDAVQDNLKTHLPRVQQTAAETAHIVVSTTKEAVDKLGTHGLAFLKQFFGPEQGGAAKPAKAEAPKAEQKAEPQRQEPPKHETRKQSTPKPSSQAKKEERSAQ